MRIPVWLTILVAALVIGFGGYRMVLALRSRPDGNRPQRGFYAMTKRSHLVIGAIYLLLGGALIAAALGWNPVGELFSVGSEAARQDTAPSKTVPVDQLPRK
jgi:hypothetical protein